MLFLISLVVKHIHVFKAFKPMSTEFISL